MRLSLRIFYWLVTLLKKSIAKEIRRFKWMYLPAKFYTVGLCLMLLRIALSPFVPLQHAGVDPLFLIPLPVTTVGLLMELYKWADKAKTLGEKNIVVRFFILGGAAVTTAVCMSYSSRVVNGVTGVAENPLPYTTAFVAVPSIMVVLVFVFIFLFLVFSTSYFLGLLSLSFSNIGRVRARTKSQSIAAKRAGRKSLLGVIRLITVSFVLLAVLSVRNEYDRALSSAVRLFAFAFEMVDHDACVNDGERLVRINSDVVLVGVAKGLEVSFRRRLCKDTYGVQRF